MTARSTNPTHTSVLPRQQAVVVFLVFAFAYFLSALLRAITGLAPIRGGQVRLDGQDITRVPASQRAQLGLAHAMEGRRIFRQLTVEENLRLAWKFGRRRNEWSGALDRVFQTFPILKEKRRTQAGLLSGGQQQMMIVSAATICNPSTLLLDEPSLGLAPMIVTLSPTCMLWAAGRMPGILVWS